MEVYAYTMTWDTGFAPCIYNGELTLACCKTSLRYKIAQKLLSSTDKGKENIYIVGLCGKVLEQRGIKEGKLNSQKLPDYSYWPVYIAKIEWAEQTNIYFSGQKKRPDQVYSYDKGSDTWYICGGNPHHTKVRRKTSFIDWGNERDITYRSYNKENPILNYVLKSTEFVFLGTEIQRGADLCNTDGRYPCLHRRAMERKGPPRGDLTPISFSETEKINFRALFELCQSKFETNVLHRNHISQYFENGCGKGECKRG